MASNDYDSYEQNRTGLVTTAPEGGHGRDQRVAANQHGADWRNKIPPAVERFSARFGDIGKLRVTG